MAAQGHEANAPTAGEYIIHHLQHLQSGKQTGVVDFSVFNMDSVFWAVSLGILTCWLLWLAARKATSGVPGRFQAAVADHYKQRPGACDINLTPVALPNNQFRVEAHVIYPLEFVNLEFFPERLPAL